MENLDHMDAMQALEDAREMTYYTFDTDDLTVEYTVAKGNFDGVVYNNPIDQILAFKGGDPVDLTDADHFMLELKCLDHYAGVVEEQEREERASGEDQKYEDWKQERIDAGVWR